MDSGVSRFCCYAVIGVALRFGIAQNNANHRIATEPGDPGVQRFIIEFEKEKSNFNYYLLIREGGVGKIRFDYVKIERISK